MIRRSSTLGERSEKHMCCRDSGSIPPGQLLAASDLSFPALAFQASSCKSEHPSHTPWGYRLWRGYANVHQPCDIIRQILAKPAFMAHAGRMSYHGEVYSILLSPGTCAATIVTLYPASARKTDVVRPVTPAPRTTICSLLAAMMT